jgi:putative oligomerization/nucleic acid binding protein
MMRRRRPLARAAMVGGAAYYAGKRGAQGQQREADQEARIQELEAQQYAAPPQQYAPPPQQYAPPPPAPAASQTDVIAQLEQLGRLHESGVLTDEEFAAQKAKLLG